MKNFADAIGALIEETQCDAHPDVVDTSCALQDWVVMAKVTDTRIEAKKRPHSKEKAFNSIIWGILGIYLGLSKKFFHRLVIPLPP